MSRLVVAVGVGVGSRRGVDGDTVGAGSGASLAQPHTHATDAATTRARQRAARVLAPVPLLSTRDPVARAKGVAPRARILAGSFAGSQRASRPTLVQSPLPASCALAHRRAAV